MKRTPMPKATKPIARRTTVKPVNRERRSAEFIRCYGSEERVAFVRRSPCVVTGCTAFPCENAHIANGGAGRKGDAETVVPLCREHHALHHRGAQTFERTTGISLYLAAKYTERRWQTYLKEDTP